MANDNDVIIARLAGALLLLFTSMLYGQGIIIDHTAVEQFNKIPAKWIEAAKKNINIYYQHTSHGSQLITGAERLETPLFKIACMEESLPDQSDALNIYEDTFPVLCSYPTDQHIPILDRYPSINVSMDAWCTELNRATSLNRFFNDMEALEKKYPNVTFVYMTGNAQSWHGHHTYTSDEEGYNRHLRNEEIRQYCRDHNKVLYDFGDIDAWYNGQQAFSTHNGRLFPREHDQYNVDQSGHTSFENCDNKARAFWYMVARLAGWDGKLVTGVELINFTGHFHDGEIELTWTTRSEQNNDGFEILRSIGNLDNFKKIGFVNGSGNSETPKQYSFVDRNVTTGNHYYRLKQMDTGGNFQLFGIIEIVIGLPDKIDLYQNYPNPFNASTTISYSLAESSQVQLKIYDITGNEICTLVNELQRPGQYSRIWNAADLPGGLFFYHIKVDNFSKAKRMLLVK